MDVLTRLEFGVWRRARGRRGWDHGAMAFGLFQGLSLPSLVVKKAFVICQTSCESFGKTSLTAIVLSISFEGSVSGRENLCLCVCWM